MAWNFRNWLEIEYGKLPEECRVFHLQKHGAALMRQYDVPEWVYKAVSGPYEVVRCVCEWHSIRTHYRGYVKSVGINVVEDGVTKAYIAQSTRKSTILESMNQDDFVKGDMVYASWQEFEMYELQDDSEIPRGEYDSFHQLGYKIEWLSMNLGQWIRSRSEDASFVQYEILADAFAPSLTRKTKYRAEVESLENALKAVPGITRVQWSIIGFSKSSLGYLDQYVQEISVSGRCYLEDPFAEKHYHLRRTDGRFVYPEDWYQCDEALLQQYLYSPPVSRL